MSDQNDEKFSEKEFKHHQVERSAMWLQSLEISSLISFSFCLCSSNTKPGATVKKSKRDQRREVEMESQMTCTFSIFLIVIYGKNIRERQLKIKIEVISYIRKPK